MKSWLSQGSPVSRVTRLAGEPALHANRSLDTHFHNSYVSPLCVTDSLCSTKGNKIQKLKHVLNSGEGLLKRTPVWVDSLSQTPNGDCTMHT